MNLRRPLSLEVLDDRIVPATLRFVGGSLYVTTDNTAQNLTFTGGAGSIKVTDTGHNNANLGTYALTGNVSVSTGNAADTVTFTITRLPGDLAIATGSGADLVNIDAQPTEGPPGA